MAIVNMNKVGVDGPRNKIKWEKEVTLAAVGTSDEIIIPKVDNITVTVIVNGCTGKMKSTTSPLADVIAGSGVYVDWSAGAVGANTQASIKAVTAIQLEQIGAGSSKMQVVAQ